MQTNNKVAHFSLANLDKFKRSNSKDDIFNGFTHGEVLFVLGAPSIGKSFLSLSMAYEASLGQPFIGISPKTGRKFRVLYAPYEDHIENLFERMSNQMAMFSDEQISTLSENFSVYLDSTPIASPQIRNMTATKAVENLIKEATQYDLVIIDTIRKAMGAALEVNDEAQIKMTLYEIAERANVGVIVNHHLTKNQGKKGGDEINTSGGSGLSSAQSQSKLHLYLNKNEKTNHLELIHSRANYIPDNLKYTKESPLILKFDQGLMVSNNFHSSHVEGLKLEQEKSGGINSKENKEREIINHNTAVVTSLLNNLDDDDDDDVDLINEVLSNSSRSDYDVFDEMFSEKAK